MGFYENLDLSQRVGKIFTFINPDDKNRIKEVVSTAASYDALPEWAKEIITDTEKKYNIFTK